jgi:hypothetical protein
MFLNSSLCCVVVGRHSIHLMLVASCFSKLFLVGEIVGAGVWCGSGWGRLLFVFLYIFSHRCKIEQKLITRF